MIKLFQKELTFIGKNLLLKEQTLSYNSWLIEKGPKNEGAALEFTTLTVKQEIFEKVLFLQKIEVSQK